MKLYRAYSNPDGSDQVRIKAENIDEARKKAKPKMDDPENFKCKRQAIL